MPTKTYQSSPKVEPPKEQIVSVVDEPRSSRGQAIFWLALIVLVIGAGAVYLATMRARTGQVAANADPQAEVTDLAKHVSALIELPKDETPTVATVLDKDKLRDQKFFAHAENGDKLLAYTKAMKAILYRPSTNKIIEVAPIIINAAGNGGTTPAATPSSAATDTSATEASIRIAYYNGTKTPGVTGDAEKLVQAKLSNTKTVLKTNAANTDYKQTVVIDLTGKYIAESGDIAQALNGVVRGALPDGEAKPEADLLIILGQ